MRIFVSGGTGFIGSHTCVALIEAGHEVVIADNLCNSTKKALDGIKEITGITPVFYEIDVTDKSAVRLAFEETSPEGVIHFAGHKAVGESVDHPLKYYFNNLISTMVLAECCQEYKVFRFVFSSSATVYGANLSPLTETMELLPAENPYGQTKVMSEQILKDLAKANPLFGVTLLRYFNPVGAHLSGKLGESAATIPTNLMPRIIMAAKGEIDSIKVFGSDYPTTDGTAIRDYIHVMDLAEGHVLAIEKIKGGAEVFNLGTGCGTSVMDLILTFERVNSVPVPFQLTGRRPGDLGICYADPSKAEKMLGFQAKRSVIDMCRDAWNFHENDPQTRMRID